jgi:hypothetical protein
MKQGTTSYYFPPQSKERRKRFPKKKGNDSEIPGARLGKSVNNLGARKHSSDMPTIELKIDGQGGAFHDLLSACATKEAPHNYPIRIESLDHGMASGAPSVAIYLQVDGHHVVFAQTTVKLFIMAAAALHGKYGDQGAFMASWDPSRGKATFTVSQEAECPKCHRHIPSSCKFCMECGAKL